MVPDVWWVPVLGLAPAVFWLWYFYVKDRYAPEPRSWILRIFVLGMVSTVPIAIVESIVALALPSDLLLAVVVAPIVEEIGKFLVVYRYVFRHPVFDEPIDGIVYAVSAALGFAALENVLYLFAAYSETLTLPLELSLLRGVLSVPGHALMSAMWGYALGQALVTPHPTARRLVYEGLLLAILLHAAFNLLASADLAGIVVLLLVLVPGMWLIASARIGRALRSGAPPE
ncbi:MAG: PrsW family intramembrane metalloprotease [Methanospirillum sp.]|nr:PrsW family intramembrane metalloprotease [Methanospirillum sp.]